MIWKTILFATLLAWYAGTEIICSNGTWSPTNVVVQNVMGTGSLVCQPPPGAIQAGGAFGAALQPDAVNSKNKIALPTPPFDVDSVIKAIQSPNYSIERVRAANRVYAAVRENRITQDDRQKLIDAMLPLARVKKDVDGSSQQPRIAMGLLGLLKSSEAIPILLDRLGIWPVFGSGGTLPVAAAALYAIGEPAIGPMLERAGTLSDKDWQMLTYVMQRFDQKKPLVRQMMRTYLDATVGAEAPAPANAAEQAQRTLVKTRLEKFLSTREPRRPKPKVKTPKPVKPAAPAGAGQ